MDAFWEIPLDQPPKVAAIGRHAHGFQPIDRFCLPDLWMLHLYSYNAELKIENLQLPIRPSYVGLVPPGKATEYRYQGISVHVFVHFRLQETGKVMRRIPAMQDLGDRYDAAYRRLLRRALDASAKAERPMMVLDPAEAAGITGPACVDGIGPADDWQGYWQRTSNERQQTKSWANGH